MPKSASSRATGAVLWGRQRGRPRAVPALALSLTWLDRPRASMTGQVSLRACVQHCLGLCTELSCAPAKVHANV